MSSGQTNITNYNFIASILSNDLELFVINTSDSSGYYNDSISFSIKVLKLDITSIKLQKTASISWKQTTFPST